MTKTKIAIYLALIFVAGAIAGGAVVMSTPETFSLHRRPQPHGSPEDFANHVWKGLKERLKLTEEQAAKVEPVFRAGFEQVTKIHERSLQEVEATVRTNHEDIARFLTDEQKSELQKMAQERRLFIVKRGHKPPPPSGEALPKAQ
jgi:Spy/CpxP family protein refolding chaperone